LCYKINVTVT